MSKYSGFFLLSTPEYEQIGDRLRLRKYGSWLVEEAWLREEQNKKRAQFTLRAIRLAKKIAQEKNISEEEAFQLLQGDSPDKSDMLGEFAEETVDLMAAMPSARDQFEQLVTLFFRNRGEVFDGKKWQSTSDWENEDTCKLPQALLEKVEAFLAMEDKREEAMEEEEDGDSPKSQG